MTVHRPLSTLPVIGSLRHHLVGCVLQVVFFAVVMFEVVCVVYAMEWQDRLFPYISTGLYLVFMFGWYLFYAGYIVWWVQEAAYGNDPAYLVKMQLGLVGWHFIRWPLFLALLATDDPTLIALGYSPEMVVVCAAGVVAVSRGQKETSR